MLNSKRLARLRLFSQIFFSLLFVSVLFYTEALKFSEFEGKINFFFFADPLLLLNLLFVPGVISNFFLIALFILLFTLFAGRFFCGWFCPMGAAQHFFSSFFKVNKKIEPKKFSTIKYFLSIFTLITIVTGYSVAGYLDPIALFTRTVSEVFLPFFYLGLHAIIKILEFFDTSYLNRRIFSGLSDSSPFLFFLKEKFHSSYYFSLLIFAFFLLITGFNYFGKRFWCHKLCPLGALLGIFSTFSLVRLRSDRKCTNCGVCKTECVAIKEEDGSYSANSSECLRCFNCQSACPESSLQLEIKLPTSPVKENPDFSRRELISGTFAGLLSSYYFWESKSSINHSSRCIRPPGAMKEKQFVNQCIRCGECQRICPTAALQPALFQAGLSGLWTPVLIPKIGYCDFECNLCQKICPTGAIKLMSKSEKKKSKIGTAFINRNHCLPYAFNRYCMVCEEVCPTSPKAIKFEKGGGNLKLPRVLPEHCIGCGICEFYCPVKGSPAIYVHAINESREPEKTFLLK